MNYRPWPDWYLYGHHYLYLHLEQERRDFVRRQKEMEQAIRYVAETARKLAEPTKDQCGWDLRPYRSIIEKDTAHGQ